MTEQRQSAPPTPLTSTCHCGAVKVTIPYRPSVINECQCTICRRYAAAWAYYKLPEITIDIREGGAVKKYVWGDRALSFNFCDHCGCVCFWLPEHDGKKMGVNTRNIDPDQLRDITRKQSYAVVNVPLRSKETAHPEDKACYA